MGMGTVRRRGGPSSVSAASGPRPRCHRYRDDLRADRRGFIGAAWLRSAYGVAAGVGCVRLRRGGRHRFVCAGDTGPPGRKEESPAHTISADAQSAAADRTRSPLWRSHIRLLHICCRPCARERPGCSVVIVAVAAAGRRRHQWSRDRRGGPRRRAAQNARHLRSSSSRIDRRCCGISVEPVNRVRRSPRFRLRFHADRRSVGVVEPGSSSRPPDHGAHSCPVQSRCGIDGRTDNRWGGGGFVRLEDSVLRAGRTHHVGYRPFAGPSRCVFRRRGA